jgi:hypothetical protein
MADERQCEGVCMSVSTGVRRVLEPSQHIHIAAQNSALPLGSFSSSQLVYSELSAWPGGDSELVPPSQNIVPSAQTHVPPTLDASAKRVPVAPIQTSLGTPAESAAARTAAFCALE